MQIFPLATNFWVDVICSRFQSPDGSSSLPSLCSPNSMSHSDEFAFMSSSLENNDIDLSMRAPYIPMNENDDLPLLTEDLMWSAFSDELSLHKNIKEVMLQQSQAMLGDGIVQHTFGTTEQMCIDGDKQPMFGAPTNPTTYLTGKDDDCKQSKLIDELTDVDGSAHKYRIDGMQNGCKTTPTSTKTSGKKYMDKTQMITNNSSEMDLIVPVNDNGIITAYTIQMVHEPILSKNG